MTHRRRLLLRLAPLLATFSAGAASLAATATYDVVIRGGKIYDGSGGAPFEGDVAIDGDSIAEVGTLRDVRGRTEIDAKGLAVAPGFINMLNHSEASLIADGKAQSAIRQGVTLEVFGELSMGPVNERMKRDRKKRQGDIQFDYEWNTLGEYLAWLSRRGISVNVASFVGAGTVRDFVIGKEDRKATAAELDQMRALVERAMDEGALGLTTALIYPPETFADTNELVQLAKVAASRGGIYTAHIRNEGNRIEEAIDETLTIARQARIPAEIYHFKLAGKRNWGKRDAIVRKIEAARAEGLQITADMYTYVAGATGLDAAMPKWVQAGGYDQWVKRLKDPATRKRVKREMDDPDSDWDNLYAAAGPGKMLLVTFKNPELKPLIGKTLAEVAAARRKSPEETAMDLVIEDGTRVGVIYFLMSEENVRRQIGLAWMAFCDDAAAMAPEGVFLKSSAHPRAYGSFARLLGKYVREEHATTPEDAIRRLTSFPASNLHLKRRGSLARGNFADVVVFDPGRIRDHATFEKPHQYSTGAVHVFVNGVQVLKDGEHTGALPGQIIHGPGWKPVARGN